MDSLFSGVLDSEPKADPWQCGSLQHPNPPGSDCSALRPGAGCQGLLQGHVATQECSRGAHKVATTRKDPEPAHHSKE